MWNRSVMHQAEYDTAVVLLPRSNRSLTDRVQLMIDGF